MGGKTLKTTEFEFWIWFRRRWRWRKASISRNHHDRKILCRLLDSIDAAYRSLEWIVVDIFEVFQNGRFVTRCIATACCCLSMSNASRRRNERRKKVTIVSSVVHLIEIVKVGYCGCKYWQRYGGRNIVIVKVVKWGFYNTGYREARATGRFWRGVVESSTNSTCS